MTTKQRIAEADAPKGTWETFHTVADIGAFEAEAEFKAKEIGGEIDWEVLYMDFALQRCISRGWTAERIAELFWATFDGYAQVLTDKEGFFADMESQPPPGPFPD